MRRGHPCERIWPIAAFGIEARGEIGWLHIMHCHADVNFVTVPWRANRTNGDDRRWGRHAVHFSAAVVQRLSRHAVRAEGMDEIRARGYAARGRESARRRCSNWTRT